MHDPFSNSGTFPLPVEKPAGRKSLSQYLISTEIWPLALIGKSIDQFGAGPVVGFVFGAAVVYAGARIAPDRFRVAAASAPAEVKKVLIEGRLESDENKSLKDQDVFVGIFQSVSGPISVKDGSFTISAPLGDEYKLAVWTPDGKTIKFFTNRVIEDHGRYSFGSVFPFTTDFGILEGTVKYTNDEPFDGWAEVAGKCVRVKDGEFHLRNVPLGKTQIEFRNRNNKPVSKQDVQFQLNETTPGDFVLPPTDMR